MQRSDILWDCKLLWIWTQKRFGPFVVCVLLTSNLEVVPFSSFKSICIYGNISVLVNIGNGRICRLGGLYSAM